MTRPKNLNTQYGRTYLNWLNDKKSYKEVFEQKIAALFAPLTTQEYQQFKHYYFGS